MKVLDDYQLELLFDNGESGTFSVKPYLRYPAFRPLENVALFHKAKVVFGTVSWTVDIDMSPDNLYLECTMYVR